MPTRTQTSHLMQFNLYIAQMLYSQKIVYYSAEITDNLTNDNVGEKERAHSTSMENNQTASLTLVHPYTDPIGIAAANINISGE